MSPRKRLRLTRSVTEMFYVYLLHSETDSGLYIGYSAALRRRLSQHKEGAPQATSLRPPWNNCGIILQNILSEPRETKPRSGQSFTRFKPKRDAMMKK